MKKELLLATIFTFLSSTQTCLKSETSYVLPKGTIICVRLLSPLNTKTAKKADTFKTQIIKPVIVNGKEVLPANAVIFGHVKSVKPSNSAEETAQLGLEFNKLVLLQEYPMEASLKEIDNARETVDESGTVVGVRAADTFAGHIDSGLRKLSEKSKTIADLLSTGTEQHRPKPSGEIEFPAGMEFSIQLNKPITLPPPKTPAARPTEKIANHSEIVSLVSRLPKTVTTQKEDRPADLINLLFVGSRDTILKGFAAAGWTEADRLDRESILKATRAVIGDSGYARAPVSTLYLFGRPEDLALQKQGNTFAKRHHVRLWRAPTEGSAGHEIWVGAATHDIGYEMVESKQVFSHRIDPEIDKEREKIKDDLMAAGAVRALQFLDRGAVTSGLTATGGSYHSDGRLLVLAIQPVE